MSYLTDDLRMYKPYPDALLDRVSLVVLELAFQHLRLLLCLLELAVGPSLIHVQQVAAHMGTTRRSKLDSLIQLFDQVGVPGNIQCLVGLEFRDRGFESVDLKRGASVRDELETINLCVSYFEARSKTTRV